MSWAMYRWAWRLCSPLHIGAMPAGSLNRTRLYIPARNVWAALTAEIARRESAASFPKYQVIGQQLQEHARFSYLFPAEQVNGRWLAWLPRYEERGLRWCREDGQDGISDRAFRKRLLDTHPGTAIAPGTGAAEDGTLRETESVHFRWRGQSACSVAFVGYVFLHQNLARNIMNTLRQIKELYIGGETRYGFGRLMRVDCSQAASFFQDAEVGLGTSEPVVRIGFAMAHTRMDGLSGVIGAMECIAGWDMVTGGLKEGELTWAPGSCWTEKRNCAIREDGLWQIQGV